MDKKKDTILKSSPGKPKEEEEGQAKDGQPEKTIANAKPQMEAVSTQVVLANTDVKKNCDDDDGNTKIVNVNMPLAPTTTSNDDQVKGDHMDVHDDAKQENEELKKPIQCNDTRQDDGTQDGDDDNSNTTNSTNINQDQDHDKQRQPEARSQQNETKTKAELEVKQDDIPESNSNSNRNCNTSNKNLKLKFVPETDDNKMDGNENGNVNDDAKTGNDNSVSTLPPVVITDTVALDRVARVLREYWQGQLSLVRLNTTQLLNDYMCVLQRMKDPESEDYTPQQVDEYLRSRHGLDCALSSCVCMCINTRNRLNSQPSDKVVALKANELMVCTVHATLLHAIDAGYQLSRAELMLQRMQSEADSESDSDDDQLAQEPDHDQLLQDEQAARLKRILAVRRQHFAGIRQDLNGDNSNSNGNASNSNSTSNGKINILPSKFVSTVEVAADNGDAGGSPSLPAYSFGCKFYYWPEFESKTAMDAAYNGGTSRYCDWYIAAKYSHLKQELMHNEIRRVPTLLWQRQYEKASLWIETKIVKKMERHRWCDYYNIDRNAGMGVLHLLAMGLYTVIRVVIDNI